MQWNRGPQGPANTTYFSCVEKGCKATLATTGTLDCNFTVKYHRNDQHNHRSDPAKNIVSAAMSDFRDEIGSNPDRSAKQLFENISTQAMESQADTPSKLDLATKLPTYRKGKSRTILNHICFN